MLHIYLHLYIEVYIHIWSEVKVLSRSVVCDSLKPQGLQPTRLLCSWNSPGKNTGVNSHSLLQEIFLTQGANLSGILQARTLEWITIPFSKRSSWPREQIWVSCIAGRLFTIWANREAPCIYIHTHTHIHIRLNTALLCQLKFQHIHLSISFKIFHEQSLCCLLMVA